MKREPEFYMIFVGLPAIIIGAMLALIGLAAMESKTYNKLTGAKTTTWDALWVELRVQESPTK